MKSCPFDNAMTIYAESFTKESPDRQLGALAATLGRIASSAEKPARAKAIVPMLEECLHFIEWTISNQPKPTHADLNDLKLMIKLWHDSWEQAQSNQHLRTLLAFQAKKWSDQVLGYSGLLN